MKIVCLKDEAEEAVPRIAFELDVVCLFKSKTRQELKKERQGHSELLKKKENRSPKSNDSFAMTAAVCCCVIVATMFTDGPVSSGLPSIVETKNDRALRIFFFFVRFVGLI